MSVSGDQEDLNNTKRDPLMDDFMETDDVPQASREPDDRKEENTESREDADTSENKREENKDSQKDDEMRAKRVFVGNLSFKTSSKQLKEYMGKVGEVLKVDIFEDKNGNSKGFGLVEYASADDAKKAVAEMNQTPLDGRQIFVREDNAKQARSNPLLVKEKRGGRRNNSPRRSGSRQRRHSKSRSRSYERGRGRNRSKSRSRSPRRRRSDRDDYERRRSRSREDRRRRSRSGSGGRNKRDRRSRSREDRKPRGGHQVIVKNMPWSVTWQQLKDAFKEYGSVIRAEVPQDGSGRSKGYGYVKFEKESEATKAIGGMDGASFNGRKITVKMYTE